MKRLHSLGLACALLLVGPAARALESDAQQPINIRARSVEANEKTGVSVYQGDVVMTQGSLRIEGDRVEVTLRDGAPQRVRAWGKPARVRTLTDTGEEVRGRGARIEYRAQPREIDLHGDVEVRRNGDLLTGARVQYALDAQTFTAQGGDGGQVTAVIQPAPGESAQ